MGEHGRASAASSSRVRLVAPGFSYKTTAYVLYRQGAKKLLESGYLREVRLPTLTKLHAARPII